MELAVLNLSSQTYVRARIWETVKKVAAVKILVYLGCWYDETNGKSIQSGHEPGDSRNMKNCQNVRKTQRLWIIVGKFGTSGKM